MASWTTLAYDHYKVSLLTIANGIGAMLSDEKSLNHKHSKDESFWAECFCTIYFWLFTSSFFRKHFLFALCWRPTTGCWKHWKLKQRWLSPWFSLIVTWCMHASAVHIIGPNFYQDDKREVKVTSEYITMVCHYFGFETGKQIGVIALIKGLFQNRLALSYSILRWSNLLGCFFVFRYERKKETNKKKSTHTYDFAFAFFFWSGTDTESILVGRQGSKNLGTNLIEMFLFSEDMQREFTDKK